MSINKYKMGFQIKDNNNMRIGNNIERRIKLRRTVILKLQV